MRTSRATEAFREEHERLFLRLHEMERRLGMLPLTGPAERDRIMKTVIDFCQREIQAHIVWEEAVLYPAVDRLAGPSAEPFTASMTHEHRIIERWIEDLVREQGKELPDAKAFGRRALMLLGLLEAHLEGEDEVLLPVVDRGMSREAFHQDILGAADHPWPGAAS